MRASSAIAARVREPVAGREKRDEITPTGTAAQVAVPSQADRDIRFETGSSPRNGPERRRAGSHDVLSRFPLSRCKLRPFLPAKIFSMELLETEQSSIPEILHTDSPYQSTVSLYEISRERQCSEATSLQLHDSRFLNVIVLIVDLCTYVVGSRSSILETRGTECNKNPMNMEYRMNRCKTFCNGPRVI